MKDFSIIKVGKGQMKVSKGDTIKTQKIEGKDGEKVVFDEVLLTSKDGKVEIGQPLVKGSKVEAEILEQFKGKKITTFKYKAKSRYRKKRGHRQNYTRLKVTKI